MTDVKKITEGIYAYKDPNAEIKRRLEEDSQNKLLFSYDEDNSLSGLMNDADLINELSQAQNELCATSVEDMSTLYSEYDNEIKETKATINEYDNTYSYDNTRLESLENTRNEIISDISKNKEDLNAVFNGEHPEVAAAQNSLNDAQDEYLKALDESNNPEIMALYDSIEENNLNIMEQEATIAYITQQITDTESQISAQESAISSLDSEISSYESQISSLQSMLSSCDNDLQEAKIRSRISNLESLKANAQARKTNEETILETLQEKLESLEEQKPKEEEKLELFKEKQNELEEQIKSIQDETINAALENLQNARQNLADIKEELVSKIQESIKNADAELKKTEEQIAKLKQELFKEEQEKLNALPLEEQPKNIQSNVYPTTSSGKPLTSASGVINNSSVAKEVTQEQMQKNLDEAKDELDLSVEELLEAYNHNSTKGAVFEARSAKDAQFSELYNELSKTDPNLAQELQASKETMDSKEEALDEIKAQLLPYDNAINSIENEIESLNIQISALLEAQTELDEVDESELDSEQKAQLREKRELIKEKLNELNEQKLELNNQINEIKTSDEYKELKNKEQQAQNEYNSAKNEFNSVLSKVESSKAKEEFETSQSDYENEKQKAQDKVTSSQLKVSELSKTLDEKNASNLAKEYSFSLTNAQDILDFATNFIGCNESDGSANKFLNGASSSSTPWCAAFVQYVLQNSGSYEDVSDWYKNISNKWYCQNVADAAQKAGATISQDEAQAGDIVLFYSDSNGRYSHIGLVTGVDEDGTVHTIEGNTSNQVAERTYAQNQRKMLFCRALD